MDKRTIKRITAQVLRDHRTLPIIISVKDAWPLVPMLNFVAHHSYRPIWARQADAAIAKRFEQIMRAMHPAADPQTMEGTREFITDPSMIIVNVTFNEAWKIVVAVQIGIFHPDMPETVKEMTIPVARQIQARIGEDYPAVDALAKRIWKQR